MFLTVSYAILLLIMLIIHCKTPPETAQMKILIRAGVITAISTLPPVIPSIASPASTGIYRLNTTLAAESSSETAISALDRPISATTRIKTDLFFIALPPRQAGTRIFPYIPRNFL